MRPICIPRSTREKELPERGLRGSHLYQGYGAVIGWGKDGKFFNINNSQSKFFLVFFGFGYIVLLLFIVYILATHYNTKIIWFTLFRFYYQITTLSKAH